MRAGPTRRAPPGEQHRNPVEPANTLRLPAAGCRKCAGSPVASNAATLRSRQDGSPAGAIVTIPIALRPQPWGGDVTWSILVRDRATGALGAAVASRFFAVGAI